MSATTTNGRVYLTDTDPTISGGLSADEGSIALLTTGSGGLWYKTGPGDVDWGIIPIEGLNDTTSAVSISTSSSNGAGSGSGVSKYDHTHAVSITNTFLNSQASFTLLTSDSSVTGLSTTPAAGTYLVIADTDCTISAGVGSSAQISLYVGGVQVTDSPRSSNNTSTTTTQQVVLFFTTIITISGSDLVEMQAHSSSGTSTLGNRSLTLLKIA